MRRLAFAFAVCLAATYLAGNSLAQTVTGNLDGYVTDPAGASVPGAQVLARSSDTGAQRAGQTNEAGYFAMAYLPIGSYDVTVPVLAGVVPGLRGVGGRRSIERQRRGGRPELAGICPANHWA